LTGPLRRIVKAESKARRGGDRWQKWLAYRTDFLLCGFLWSLDSDHSLGLNHQRISEGREAMKSIRIRCFFLTGVTSLPFAGGESRKLRPKER
jgi:hypothetical protein